MVLLHVESQPVLPVSLFSCHCLCSMFLAAHPNSHESVKYLLRSAQKQEPSSPVVLSSRGEIEKHFGGHTIPYLFCKLQAALA